MEFGMRRPVVSIYNQKNCANTETRFADCPVPGLAASVSIQFAFSGHNAFK